MKLTATILLLAVCTVFPQNHKKVRVFIENEFALQNLASLSLAIDHSIRDREGGLSFFVDENEFSKLQASGLAYEILIDDWKSYYSSLPVPSELEKIQFQLESKQKFGVGGFKFGSMGGYYTFAEIIADLDTMFALYPNLITEKFSIGTSVEGRTIWAVRISDNPNINEDEPSVGFDALVHAREPQSMATLMYFMWYLLENYGTDPAVTYLVDNREIYCVPCFNPDGYEYNRQIAPGGGGMWRKNRRDNGGSCYGVDLNRNFGHMWGYDNNGSSPDSCSNTYRGPSAFSEPESQAVRDLALSDNYGTHFNMHSYGNYYLYPWGYMDQETPDSLTYREFAGDMGSLNGYEYGTGYQLLGYPSNGSVRDWMYGEQTEKNKIFGYTLEIGPSFWPNQNQIFPIAQQNVKSNMYHAFVAGEYLKLVDPNFSKELFLPTDVIHLIPEYRNVGLVTAYNLDFDLTSPSQYVTVINGNVELDSLEARSSASIGSNLTFAISNSVPVEEEIPIVLTASANGRVMRVDTMTIVIGFPVYVFSDTTNDPEELWTITATPSFPKWEATFAEYYSEPTSFTDSKNGNYQNNATVTMTLTNPVNLLGLTNPRLTFQTKYNIESNYDYGQVDVSTNNGSSWIPLEGEYTEPGEGNFQPNGEPVYDGALQNWGKEEINLTDYISSQFKVRFQLRTDSFVTRDGWYLDDIGIFIYTIPVGLRNNTTEPVLSFSLEQNYPNPFNPTTKIKFTIPPVVASETKQSQLVRLKIYDVLGNEIATLINEEMTAGYYEVEFSTRGGDAHNLPSGVYFYMLNVKDIFFDVKKMILIK